MEAFNSSEMVEKETYKLMQNTFWEPDPEKPQNIKRTHKITDARLGMSEFTHGIVNQARLHELLLDGMANAVTNLRPHYSRELVDLMIDERKPFWRCRSLSSFVIEWGLVASFLMVTNLSFMPLGRSVLRDQEILL